MIYIYIYRHARTHIVIVNYIQDFYYNAIKNYKGRYQKKKKYIYIYIYKGPFRGSSICNYVCECVIR